MGCGTRVIDTIDISVDHTIPLSRGGGNALGNLVPCCRRCNEAKGAMDGGEWEALVRCLNSDYFADSARNDILARLRAGGKRRMK